MPRLVPEAFNRNARRVRSFPPEHTGKILLDLVLGRLGWADVASADILDIGCGVRFTQTFLNLELPVWEILSLHPRDRERFIQHQFLCAPA